MPQATRCQTPAIEPGPSREATRSYCALCYSRSEPVVSGCHPGSMTASGPTLGDETRIVPFQRGILEVGLLLRLFKLGVDLTNALTTGAASQEQRRTECVAHPGLATSLADLRPSSPFSQAALFRQSSRSRVQRERLGWVESGLSAFAVADERADIAIMSRSAR